MHTVMNSGAHRKQVAIIVLVVVACLAPFLDRAYHIDDPLFLWTARYIQEHPLDFYSLSVNWYGTEMPMYAVTKNPPLASYYIAAFASVFGWSETAMHAVFLLPSVAAAAGMYFLALELCSLGRHSDPPFEQYQSSAGA